MGLYRSLKGYSYEVRRTAPCRTSRGTMSVPHNPHRLQTGGMVRPSMCLSRQGLYCSVRTAPGTALRRTQLVFVMIMMSG